MVICLSFIFQCQIRMIVYVILEAEVEPECDGARQRVGAVVLAGTEGVV